jgi:hypothetical protein
MRGSYVVEWEGQTVSLYALSKRFRIHYQALRRWYAAGQLAENISRLLELRELRETAVKNNVSLHTASVRRWRGWSILESYTVPHCGRRKQNSGQEKQS